MTHSSIKTGIIGYGYVGSQRRKPNISENPNYNLVAICDIDETKFDDSDVSFYTDYRTMIDECDLDAVFVCVPHSEVTRIVVYALRKQLNVFMEKPPGIHLSDTKYIKETKDKFAKDKVLMVGFNHRYFSHIAHAKEYIQDGILGELFWIDARYGKTYLSNWRLDKDIGGRGILLSQGIHMLDLFRYLADDEFEIKDSLVSNYNKEWYDDDIMILMRSKDKNINGSIHSSCKMGQNIFNIHLGFEHGYIIIDGMSMSRTMNYGFPDTFVVGFNSNGDESFPDERVFYYGRESGEHSWNHNVEKFALSILYKTKDYSCNIDDAMSVMKLVEDTYGN